MNLDEYWCREFGSAAPLAHELRVTFRHRWVRFHSLPDARRYPTSDRDWLELLARHNAIIGDLTEPERPLTLLTSFWGTNRDVQRPELGEHHATTVLWRIVEAPDADSLQLRILQTTVAWTPGTLDGILCAVAEDQLRNVM